MHTYIAANDVFTVGYYVVENDSETQWMPLKDFSQEQHAARFVNYLNGGMGNPWVPPETN